MYNTAREMTEKSGKDPLHSWFLAHKIYMISESDILQCCGFRRVRMKPGQEITVSEGFVSGYVLKVIDKKISIRVKRIK